MKNKNAIVLSIFIFLYAAVYATIIDLIYFFVPNQTWAIWLMVGASALVFANIFILFFSYLYVKRKREKIEKSFDYYIDSMVATTGVGLIAFNSDGDVIWTSKFVDRRISRKLIGKSILCISDSFKEKYEEGQVNFRFDIKKIKYEAKVDYENKALVIKDITNESNVLELYAEEKLVVGELEIDNFQQFQLILSPEDLFRIQSEVISMLDKIAERLNFSYRQYINGKFFIITNQTSLDVMKANRFNFLDDLRKVNLIDGIQLSASIGFGINSVAHKKLIALAKEGLMQAQSRGGDQVGVISVDSKPEFFGSKSEIAKTTSRIKINQIASLFENSLSNTEIKNVVIFGHVYADLDAVGSALGMASIAQSFDKKVYIQNVIIDGTTTDAMKNLTEEEQALFVKSSKIKNIVGAKNTLVVVVDTAEEHRTEFPEFIEKVRPENLFVFDHHRVGSLNEKILKTNSYIDTTASSASEIVIEVIQFIKKNVKLSKSIAQMMLNGIYLDTMQFQKSTSARTFEASAYLEKRGAKGKNSIEVLKNSEEETNVIAEILANVSEVKPGYFISSYAGAVGGDIVSKAADEMLRTSGRKAAFVIAKVPDKKAFKLSARGLDTNVQLIAEAVGGGGHFGAAAAVSNEPLNIFTENVRHAIVTSVKETI